MLSSLNKPPIHDSTLHAFLHADVLRHITPLKILTLFGEALRPIRIAHDEEHGYVLMIARSASQWDTQKYPAATHVVYLALPAQASDALIDVAARTVLRETDGESFVIKLNDVRVIERLQVSGDPRTPLRYVLSLLSFIPAPNSAALCHNNLPSNVREHIYDYVPSEALALLAKHNVYNSDELSTLFADGTARCWLRFVDADPVAVLLTFANAPTLHEIGSLYVRDDARRQGHAQALVRAAINDLNARGLLLRYVVDATNTPSIALAEHCGLREALRLEHWQSC